MTMPRPGKDTEMPTWNIQSSSEESEFQGFDDESSQPEEKSQPDKKDDEEAELERLVFGTSADFREDISRFAENSSRKGRSESQKTEDIEVDQEVDLNNVDDADVRKHPFLTRKPMLI
jgi:hypothetical protein